MKHFTLVILATGFSFMAAAQRIPERDVPSVVLNAFQSKFSKATDVEWKKESLLYKVEFEVDKKDHDLWIANGGDIVKHEEEIAAADLPAEVSRQLESDFAGFDVDDVNRVEAKGKIFYRVELERGKDDREVIFSADGAIRPGIE